MSDVLLAWSERVLVFLSVTLLIGPVAFFLVGPWVYRRHEIMEGLSRESVKLYFSTFHPALASTPDFLEFYNARFGRQWYVLPALMLVATGFVAAVWCVRSVLVWLQVRPGGAGTLPAVAVLALAGAYL